MSKEFKDDAGKLAYNLFGGLAASNLIGKAMQTALEQGYTGIAITFTKKEEAGE